MEESNSQGMNRVLNKLLNDERILNEQVLIAEAKETASEIGILSTRIVKKLGNSHQSYKVGELLLLCAKLFEIKEYLKSTYE